MMDCNLPSGNAWWTFKDDSFLQRAIDKQVISPISKDNQYNRVNSQNQSESNKKCYIPMWKYLVHNVDNLSRMYPESLLKECVILYKSKLESFLSEPKTMSLLGPRKNRIIMKWIADNKLDDKEIKTLKEFIIWYSGDAIQNWNIQYKSGQWFFVY